MLRLSSTRLSNSVKTAAGYICVVYRLSTELIGQRSFCSKTFKTSRQKMAAAHRQKVANNDIVDKACRSNINDKQGRRSSTVDDKNGFKAAMSDCGGEDDNDALPSSPKKLARLLMHHVDSSPYFAEYHQREDGESRNRNDIPSHSDTNNRTESYETAYTTVHLDDKQGRPIFDPKKILILTKLTRLEFERRTNPTLSDLELRRALQERGSDYSRLVSKNRIHTKYVSAICDELKKRDIEYRLVQRWDYTEENIDWADAIFTAGGDGTFLLAASKIRNRNKPVIGINTDPTGSEGYMCLLRKLPENKFSEALSKLLRGEFNWIWRQRIRVTLSGKHAFEDPVELHDQQLMYPEYRWAEHVREYEDVRARLKTKWRGCASSPSLKSHDVKLSPPLAADPGSPPPPGSPLSANERVLPFLALNEVFIGESLSSRVSYYELQLDDSDRIKQKSSGLTVCTGTGSTSWYFNINKLTDKCVADLMNIITDDLGIQLPSKDPAIVSRLCRRFNDQLIFSPSDLRMAFTVRDPVFNATYKAAVQRGFARRVVVKSRGFDAHLVIDGGLSFNFNDGAQATLELHAEDALRTVVFR